MQNTFACLLHRLAQKETTNGSYTQVCMTIIYPVPLKLHLFANLNQEQFNIYDNNYSTHQK